MHWLSVGKRTEIWSLKFESSWHAKLESLSNTSLTVSHVRCVMNVIIRLWISLTAMQKPGDSQVRVTQPDYICHQGAHDHDMPCTWRLPWVSVEQPWSPLAGPFSPCWHKWVQKPFLSPFGGTISRSVGIFQSGWVFTGQRALTIESLLMSGCG